MANLTDTHCHLNMIEPADQLAGSILRAKNHNVYRILCPAVDLLSGKTAINLSHWQKDFVFAAVGIHPNNAQNIEREDINQVEVLASDTHVKAIGEIGLDFFREYATPEIQKEVFKSMLSIAEKINLPVCIHNRDADNEIIEILTEWVSNFSSAAGVFHSFNGSEIILDWGLKHNFYFGISGPVTYNNAQHLQKTVRDMPLERILIETDSPYLAPAPFRGKENEPANVKIIAHKIAQIKKMDFDTVADITSKNAIRLFKWE